MANILAIRFGALGDVAISVPVLYSFARNYPQHNLYFATRTAYTKLFVNKPENLHVIDVNLKEYDGFMGLNRFYEEKLRELKIDAVADIHNVMRSWIWDLDLDWQVQK